MKGNLLTEVERRLGKPIEVLPADLKLPNLLPGQDPATLYGSTTKEVSPAVTQWHRRATTLHQVVSVCISSPALPLPLPAAAKHGCVAHTGG